MLITEWSPTASPSSFQLSQSLLGTRLRWQSQPQLSQLLAEAGVPSQEGEGGDQASTTGTSYVSSSRSHLRGWGRQERVNAKISCLPLRSELSYYCSSHLSCSFYSTKCTAPLLNAMHWDGIWKVGMAQMDMALDLTGRLLWQVGKRTTHTHTGG